MALNLPHLDTRTRGLMIQEIDRDIAADILHKADGLNPQGLAVYPLLLKEAVGEHNNLWLMQQLTDKFNVTETVTIQGKLVTRKMRSNAAEILADGEFNRFYLRGLCLRAIEDNIPSLIIYRAKAVKNPRPDSEAKIGTIVSPTVLLANLRISPKNNPTPIVPMGPGSKLSARLP